MRKVILILILLLATVVVAQELLAEEEEAMLTSLEIVDVLNDQNFQALDQYLDVLARPGLAQEIRTEIYLKNILFEFTPNNVEITPNNEYKVKGSYYFESPSMTSEGMGVYFVLVPSPQGFMLKDTNIHKMGDASYFLQNTFIDMPREFLGLDSISTAGLMTQIIVAIGTYLAIIFVIIFGFIRLMKRGDAQ